MTRPIALQLYSLRDELAHDFESTIRRVAAIGYAGVETAGFPAAVTPSQAKALFDELGLAVCAAHAPLPLGDKQQEALDLMATLGTDRMISAYMPPEEYSSLSRTVMTVEQFNEAAAVATANGLRLGVHNHWWEFEPLPGNAIRPYQVWLDQLDPAVFFELDTYWAQVGGVSPLDALAALGDRVELLHVKDGPADSAQSDMTAVGQGTVDYTGIIPAASSVEWLIVELDRCATDMLAAVEMSYTYLVDKDLGHGRH
jgi:sugar phosphate isomerase/epimerase